MAIDTRAMRPVTVIKRDGREVSFDQERIKTAIARAMAESGEGDPDHDPQIVSDYVVEKLIRSGLAKPAIEEIQDKVEESLMFLDFAATAKAYILYRNDRARAREKNQQIPEYLKDLVSRSKEFFPTPAAEFTYYRTDSRWLEQEGRRETWIETAQRYVDYMRSKLGDKLSDAEYSSIHKSILGLEVFGSRRLLWSAGPACDHNNATAYNCSYIAIRSLGDFAEVMYLLMNGCGVGYSVETQNIQQLPIIRRQSGDEPQKFTIQDSKEGWAEALTFGIESWFAGEDVEFIFSELRSAGARLRTMGGRSSGPGPLSELLQFARGKILARQGRRLRNIDAHDILCLCGRVIEMGGVRRAAEISLSDLDDELMRDAKKGQFFHSEPQRMFANNSVAYDTQPSNVEFLEEWLALAKSGSGERGIFNRGSLFHQIPVRRAETLLDGFETVGTNPCGEIILKSKEFCNLSEVIARPSDTKDDLRRKIKIATILGTYQSSLTYFPNLSPEWTENCEQERLLGVSITGWFDCPALWDSQFQQELRQIAVATNFEYAERFGIPASRSVTCVKPSGNGSQIADCASGLHPRYAPYYIRRFRVSVSDPLLAMMRDQGYPVYPETGQTTADATTFVVEFPIKAPETTVVFRKSLTALEHLEIWKGVKQNFTEHNPSVTIQVGTDEWIDVADWVYSNWDLVGGLTFLPRDDTVYPLAPYEEITEEQYHSMVESLPTIDFSQILLYEKADETTGSKTLACTGDSCEI